MPWRHNNYEILPALSVRRRELRRSLRLVTVAWMWGIVWQAAISGDQMRAFVTMVGFNDFAFGLMGAIPFLATFAQLPSAILVERIGFRKHACLDAFMLSRIMWVFIAVVPLAFWPGREGSTLAVTIVLALMAASYLLHSAAVPLWWTWMGDLIPRRIRGRYLARRHQLTTLVQVIAIFVISYIVQKYSSPDFRGRENAADQPQLMRTLAILLAGCSVFGVIDVILFRGVRDIADTYPDRRPPKSFDFAFRRPPRWTPLSAIAFAARAPLVVWRELFGEPMSNPLFRSYIGFGFVITFSMTVGGWFYIKHASEYLQFSPMGINVLFLVIGPISAIIFAPVWGRLIDHWGRRPSLMVAATVTLLSALPWFFARPGLMQLDMIADGLNAAAGWAGSLVGHDFVLIPDVSRPLTGPYLLIGMAAVLGGFGWSGIGLAQSGVILALSDLAKEKKNKYVAVSSLVVNLGGAVGGLSGGLVAQGCQGFTLGVGPMVWNNYHLTFAIAMFVRFGAMAFIARMPDPQGRPLAELPRAVGQWLLRAMRLRRH